MLSADGGSCILYAWQHQRPALHEVADLQPLEVHPVNEQQAHALRNALTSETQVSSPLRRRVSLAGSSSRGCMAVSTWLVCTERWFKAQALLPDCPPAVHSTATTSSNCA